MNEDSSEMDYLILCNSMTGEERLLKGFELSEWSMLTNKYIDEEISKLLTNVFVLV